jgi:hypothetical protein
LRPYEMMEDSIVNKIDGEKFRIFLTYRKDKKRHNQEW